MRTLLAIAFSLSIFGCGGVESTPTTVEEQQVRVPDPCYVDCQGEFDDCNRSCAWDVASQNFCLCECSNQRTLCIGGCNGGRHNPLRWCEPPNEGP